MHLSRWSIPNNTINGVRQSLNEEHHTALEAADYFFASLRIATGFTTGYAQVLFAPKSGPQISIATYLRYMGPPTAAIPSHSIGMGGLELSRRASPKRT